VPKSDDIFLNQINGNRVVFLSTLPFCVQNNTDMKIPISFLQHPAKWGQGRGNKTRSPIAILQTSDLPDPIFAWVPRLCCPSHVLTVSVNIRLIAKMASASSGSQLAGSPKNQNLFWGITFRLTFKTLRYNVMRPLKNTVFVSFPRRRESRSL